jgi:DNA-directed RNA polymerase subunit RPC12/RpoP
MRLEVTDLLDTRQGRGVLGIVHAWAEVIRDQRQQPARCTCGHLALGHTHYGTIRCTAKKCHCHAYTPIPPTVTAECALLIANLPWLVEQDFAGDLYDEIRVLNRTLTDTLGDYRARPVGSCAVLGERPGVPLPVLCGGALVMDREGHGVKCTRCGTTVRADEGLRELGLIVGSLIRDTGSEREAS